MPEMRLIDANALQNLLLPIATGLEKEYGSLGGAVSGVMMHIDNAPTVDAAPVVHSFWSYDDEDGHNNYDLHCDRCGGSVGYRCGNPVKSKYCPNCGANMDGGGSDD